MSHVEMWRCPDCKRALVEDVESGEAVCVSCGRVVAEQLSDNGPDPTSPDIIERNKLLRAAGMTSYAQHDLGITTEISQSARDFSGKSIGASVASHMQRLRKWQQRARVLSSKERRLASMLTKIGEMCHTLNLPRNVRETAAIIYRSLDNQIDVRGKFVVSMSIAIIYIACKQCEVAKTMDEIAREVCPPKEVKIRRKLAGRYYRSIVMGTSGIATPAVTMNRHISKIANLSRADVRAERLALQISEKVQSRSLTEGKTPNGIAAAYLYIASALLNHNMAQRDISSVAGITEVTIRNRCREIMSIYRFRVTLHPARERLQ